MNLSNLALFHCFFRCEGMKEGVSAQLCLTFCDSIDCISPGSSVLWISQAKYWSRLPFPTPGDLPNPGLKPTSLMPPALAGEFLPLAPPGKAWVCAFEQIGH